jgi:hypothetical protein
VTEHPEELAATAPIATVPDEREDADRTPTIEPTADADGSADHPPVPPQVRPSMTWRHRALVLAWTAPPVALLMAMMGFWPGLSPTPLAWLLGAGNIECTANQGLGQLSSWCEQVGAPIGSPLLSGLPQTYFAAWLTYLPSVDAWDAYRIMSVVCIAAGFAGGYALLRRWSAPVWLSALASYLYLASPSVLMLNGYTFSFHGYILMPAGLWLALKSLDLFAADRKVLASAVAVGTAFLLVFTDGYSFVGGAVALLGFGIAWLLTPDPGRRQKIWGAGVWAGSMLLAVGAYLLYVPSGSTHPAVGIGVFRFYGVDALTLVLPSPLSWWARKMPWNTTFAQLWGSSDNQFGNYVGIVCLALIVVAITMGALRRTSPRGRELIALAAIGVATLVLSFGPGLKIANFANDLIQGQNVPLDQTRLWLPTAWLYEYVPGFMDMRATYRTFTVTRFVSIALACVGLAAIWRSRTWVRLLAPLLAVLLVLDLSVDVPRQIRARAGAHKQMDLVRTQIQPDLMAMIRPGEKVLILPAGNDFVATALVPFTGGTSYNVGVDKNHDLSRDNWPAQVKSAISSYGKASFPDAACTLLKNGTDVIVLSYWSMFQAGVNSATGPVQMPNLKKNAQKVAATGRFDTQETNSGIAIRRGPGC